MKRLAILVITAALAWSGYWGWQANATRNAVEAWFSARASDGWRADYSDISLRGFPNRLDITVQDLAIKAPDAPLVTAPFLQSFQLVYQPGHQIFAFPDTMTIGQTTLSSQGLRASLVQQNGEVDRANLEAEVLNLAGPESRLALAGVRAAFRLVGPNRYQIAFAADGFAGPDGPLSGGATDGLRLNAHVTFDQPWRLDAMLLARPQPTQIALDLFEIEQSSLVLKLAGALDIDSMGKGTGRVTLRAENWRTLLENAQNAGQIGPAIAQAITEALTIYATLTGNGRDLDLPLDLDAGALRLGLIALGQAPRFTLP